MSPLVSAFLRGEMAKRGLRPSAFADALGVSRPLLSMVLSGKKRVSLATLAKWARSLGLPQDASDLLLDAAQVDRTPERIRLLLLASRDGGGAERVRQLRELADLP